MFSVRNVKDTFKTAAKCKSFLRELVVDNYSELNKIRNDVGFLMSELYGADHSSNFNVQFTKGWIFYIWVCMEDKVFPFDIFYMRRDLPEDHLDFIAKTMDSVQARLLHRRPFEKVQIPDITVLKKI